MAARVLLAAYIKQRYIYPHTHTTTNSMKRSFQTPRITYQGSLQAVTAAASGPIDSDSRLKRDIESYDPVLSRLNKLSSSTKTDELEGRKQFQKPEVNPEGSLKSITATISEPGPSDASLKVDVESYDPVLPRLKKLS